MPTMLEPAEGRILVSLFSETPPAGSQDLGEALCLRHGARAARWMRTEDVDATTDGAVVSPQRVEVFALAGLIGATVGYAWEPVRTPDQERGRIVTMLASKGIDSALAAVVAFKRAGLG